jgi:hypothetical protein
MKYRCPYCGVELKFFSGLSMRDTKYGREYKEVEDLCLLSCDAHICNKKKITREMCDTD